MWLALFLGSLHKLRHHNIEVESMEIGEESNDEDEGTKELQ